MSPSILKGIGIGCFVLVAILLFVAWERYQDNASKVEAANKMMQSSPLGGMMKDMTGGAKLEPGMPTATNPMQPLEVHHAVNRCVHEGARRIHRLC